MRTHCGWVPFAILVTSSLMPSAAAQTVDEMQQRAVQFLAVTQNSDGSWTSSDAVGITGLVTTSLIMSGKTTDDPLVKKGLEFLMAMQQTYVR